MTDTSLDKILSGAGEAAPAPEKTETVTEQPTASPSGAAPAESPEQGEQQGGGDQATVPLAALHAEKQKAKRYTEQLAEVEKKLAEQNSAWEQRFNRLVEALKPQQQQPQQAPDWYENPNAAALSVVAPHLAQFQQGLLAVAKDTAITRYTEAKVDEAEKSFLKAYETGALDPADYQKVITSPNRYAAAVQWHQRQTALSEIGDDPAAFKEKTRAELKAEILKELEAKQAEPGQQQEQQPAPVMPSNLVGARNVGARTGPAWSGPKQLNDIFAWRSQQP